MPNELPPASDALVPDPCFKKQARVLKALAHPTRLAVVDRLSRGEASAGELAELAGCAPSTMSKHLAILRAHGIVDDRREGTMVFYALLTPCVMGFFSCTLDVIRESR